MVINVAAHIFFDIGAHHVADTGHVIGGDDFSTALMPKNNRASRPIRAGVIRAISFEPKLVMYRKIIGKIISDTVVSPAQNKSVSKMPLYVAK